MRKSPLAVLGSLALISALAPAAASPARMSSDKDLLTDKFTHFLFLDSSTTVRNSINDQKPAILSIRCKADEEMDLYIYTPTYNSDNNTVKIRWGDGGIQKERWISSSDSDSFFAPKPVTFLKQLIENDQLVFGWRPYSRTENAVAFDLAVERENFKKMVDLCGVTFKPVKPKGSSSSTKRPGRDR